MGNSTFTGESFFFLFFLLKNVVKIKEIQVCFFLKLVWRTRFELLYLRWLWVCAKAWGARADPAGTERDGSRGTRAFAWVRTGPPRTPPESESSPGALLALLGPLTLMGSLKATPQHWENGWYWGGSSPVQVPCSWQCHWPLVTLKKPRSPFGLCVTGNGKRFKN